MSKKSEDRYGKKGPGLLNYGSKKKEVSETKPPPPPPRKKNQQN